MEHQDDEDLKPTPGERVKQVLKEKDVRQVLFFFVLFTALFSILGLWAYPRWMPNIMSKEMRGDESIMIWFTVISAPIAGIVLAFAMRSFIDIQRGDTPPEDGPAISGHTPTVVIWTAVSFLFCTVAIVWGMTEMNTWSQDAIAKESNAMVVNVTGAQWSWSFNYPAQGITTHELNLPVKQPITFNVISDDVNHSFWPVELGVKVDANRLATTVVHVTPDKIGAFEVKCAELCGIYHAYMETNGQVESRADFDNWVSTVKAQGGAQ